MNLKLSEEKIIGHHQISDNSTFSQNFVRKFDGRKLFDFNLRNDVEKKAKKIEIYV